MRNAGRSSGSTRRVGGDAGPEQPVTASTEATNNHRDIGPVPRDSETTPNGRAYPRPVDRPSQPESERPAGRRYSRLSISTNFSPITPTTIHLSNRRALSP